jgi:hypothetical protein
MKHSHKMGGIDAVIDSGSNAFDAGGYVKAATTAPGHVYEPYKYTAEEFSDMTEGDIKGYIQQAEKSGRKDLAEQGRYALNRHHR